MNELTVSSGPNSLAVRRHKLNQVEQMITEQLPQELRSYVQLRQEAPVSAFITKSSAGQGHTQLRTYCHEIIVRAFFDFIGGQSEPEIITFQTQALLEEFTKTRPFQQLTISEVKEAFRKGIRGHYGSFFGMCPRTYHLFLQGYLSEQKRAESWQKYTGLIEAAEKDTRVSTEIKIRNSKQALVNLFEEYKATGYLGVCPWAYCSVLAEFIGTEVEYAPGKVYKTFVTDETTRELLNRQAEEEYRRDLELVVPKDPIYGGNKVAVDDKLMRAVIQAGIKKEDSLSNKKKEVALRWYFDRLIQNEETLQL